MEEEQKMSRNGSIVLTMVFVGFCISNSAQAQPASSQGMIPFQTIHTDGKQILLTQTTVLPGKAIPEEYTVKIPIKTPAGNIEYRTETRTRMVRRTKSVQVPASADYHFTRLDGKALDREKLIKEIPKTGQPVVVVYGKAPLAEAWKQLLHREAVIMRFDPIPVDDEAK